MTAFNQKFLRGGPDATRGQFFQKAPPLAAGGKKFLLILYTIAYLAGHVFVVDGFFHVDGVTDAGKI